MARFYAAIANNGKLVRPHLAMQVEEGGGTPNSPPRVVHNFPAAAPQSLGLDPHLPARRAGRALAGDALRATGRRQKVFGNFPVPIAGKTGTAQKDPNTDQQDQSWWCGYGPAESTTPPELVVCALIENGGFGADAAAPAALQVFKEYFKKQLDSGQVATMIEAVGTRARGLRPQRPEAVEAASAIRRLDWWLVGATAGAARVRALGDPRDHRARRDRATRTTSSSARGSTRRSGWRARSRCCSSTRSSTAATCGRSTSARRA